MSLFLQPTYLISLLIAITVHEWSHAFVATRLGDPTPHNSGRLTLNPIAHLDPLGALLFLTAGFGWAKPVPVNASYFHHPRRDLLLTAAAGPVSNLLLAILAFIGLLFIGWHPGVTVWELLSPSVSGSIGAPFFSQLFAYSLFVNLGLMAFNLLPVAPLDGSKVLEASIPPSMQDTYDDWMRYGPYVLLFLLLGENFLGIPLLSSWITWIMDAVLGLFARLSGVA